MYRLFITNQKNKTSYDVSTIAHSIEHFTSILGQPGKLSFILEKDPNNILQICEGNIVQFYSGEKGDLGIFYGKVFTVGTDSTEAYRVVAYDQTRYLKNKDTIFIENKTINDLFDFICKRNAINKKTNEQQKNVYESKVNSSYKLQNKLFNNKTYFEMLKESIEETLQFADGNPYFFIRDNFGTIELNELMSAKTDYFIGDESLLTDYKYEIDIDKDTYNKVVITRPKEDKSIEISTVKFDKHNIAEWGVLQQIINVPQGTTDVQVDNYAKLYLQLKNRVLKTIQIEALGIDKLNAGDGFKFQLQKLGIDAMDMFILSATHKYDADLHTMSLEVSGFGSLAITTKKDEKVLIGEIIDGKWGNGEIRKNNLTEAGYSYPLLQNKVNQYYVIAYQVVDGKWGPVQYVSGEYILSEETKNKLATAGYDPQIIDKVFHASDF